MWILKGLEKYFNNNFKTKSYFLFCQDNKFHENNPKAQKENYPHITEVLSVKVSE